MCVRSVSRCVVSALVCVIIKVSNIYLVFNKDVGLNIFLGQILANVMKIDYVPFLYFTTSILA